LITRRLLRLKNRRRRINSRSMPRGRVTRNQREFRMSPEPDDTVEIETLVVVKVVGKL
jgi:hypothetical protein